MTLRQKQSLFVRCLAQLLRQAQEMGYDVTLGEAWRPPETAKLYSEMKPPKGIANSLHTQRLAIDLNLFKGGVLLSKVSDYEPLGRFWTSINVACRWGGDFKSKDAVHFSIEHEGRA